MQAFKALNFNLLRNQYGICFPASTKPTPSKTWNTAVKNFLTLLGANLCSPFFENAVSIPMSYRLVSSHFTIA
jgi:hypothetical protein